MNTKEQNEQLRQGAFAQMERERALKEIISERLTTNEKQNVYASKKYNEEILENQLRVNAFNLALKKQMHIRLERQHEYENRLMDIEERIRSLTDKKIYFNDCIETAVNEHYILKEQIINK